MSENMKYDIYLYEPNKNTYSIRHESEDILDVARIVIEAEINNNTVYVYINPPRSHSTWIYITGEIIINPAQIQSKYIKMLKSAMEEIKNEVK